MQHINYARRVCRRANYSLRRFMFEQPSNSSFAAFCGTVSEREAVALYGIARSCGRHSIVILHDDPHFDSRLGELYGIQQGNYDVYAANRPGSYIYDPLYGMDEVDVLDAIIPLSPSSTAITTLMQQRAALRDYLCIMQWQQNRHIKIFGQSPYNLDLLYSLVKMPYEQLAARVLTHLPNDMASDLSGRLSALELQQNVWSAVSNFAARMQSTLWAPNLDWTHHTRCSISSAVEANQIISVRIPGSNTNLLHYIATEIQGLQRKNKSFLLVCYNLRFQGCETIENIIWGKDPYITHGVVAPSLQGVMPIDRVPILLETHEQVLVFSCGSATEAEAFSAAQGDYYRVVRSPHHHAQWRLFSLLPMLSFGRSRQESEVRNVRPEELMNGGVLLCGKSIAVPVLVNHLLL